MAVNIFIAPHPDDETLGCGGTILRKVYEDEKCIWLIITRIGEDVGYSEEQVSERADEIHRVAGEYGFYKTIRLDYPTTMLDTVPMGDLIGKLNNIFKEYRPNEIYVPYRRDIHTDHRVVFDAVASCLKWFRNPCFKRVLVYETISETDFNMNPDSRGFRPNVFINVSKYFTKKLNIFSIYRSEKAEFPFPRSREALESLASLRGAASGFNKAEAFMLLFERF